MDQIDRELASLLSVEPSPEFRARVRVRIASGPAPRAWLPGWGVVAGVAVLSMAAALVVGRSQLANQTRRDRAPAGPSSVASGPVASGFPPSLRFGETRWSAQRGSSSRTIDSAPQAVAAAPVSSGQESIRRRRQRTADEVLVAASEVRGFRQLAAIVREGHMQFVFSNEPVSDTAIEPVRDIVVAPLAIAPIESPAIADFGATAEGDNQ